MGWRRHDGRRADELRKVKITPGFIRTADGSCLIETGGTRAVCTASLVAGVPKWRSQTGLGWVTAEYGMLPASTAGRKSRSTTGQDGRSVEIQRIIGRVIRNVVRFDRLGENTFYLDCDVLEADGGTRTAAITGAFVALACALEKAAREGHCQRGTLSGAVGAVSVGMIDGRAVLDMDYQEDSVAEVDMNVAMTAGGKYIEVQGSAEPRLQAATSCGPEIPRAGFTATDLDKMLALARKGIRKLLAEQKRAINKACGK